VSSSLDSSAISGGTTTDSADSSGMSGETATTGTKDYQYQTPPDGPFDPVFSGQVWLDHFRNDLLPYWTAAEAKGDPLGNFPTYRGMDGSIQKAENGSDERRPRMLSRQIYAYSIGYLLTGDESLLELARAGADWLIGHARDTTRGGWYELLDGQGAEKGEGPKYAQDTAYCLVGLAAYFFVTRDPAVEQVILETINTIFDPQKYWDAANNRVKDGLDYSMTTEVDYNSDNGWELVAQLDQINAYLLLIQPVLSDAGQRTAMLDKLELLANTMIKSFFQDGIFWGVSNKKGVYGSRHADFGHNLKSYWMILEIDKRLPDHPFYDFLQANAATWVNKAYDAQYGRWAKRMKSKNVTEYGSDWWIYAEADQIASTLNLIDYGYLDILKNTETNWLHDYVDKDFPVREVYPSITREGGKAWNWSQTDTAKCNLWKNGFHSSEHALVMYLLGQNLNKTASTLYFAVPAEMTNTFIARPYIFEGREVSRQDRGEIEVASQKLRKIELAFDQIY
jgi:mannose/cellobiose epimerase-like protein (N-acyl-D-glucosamine 2-epimerase family)